MKLLRLRRTHVLVLFAVILAVPRAASAKDTKSFKMKGAGAGEAGLPLPGQEPRPHWAEGTASHFGHYFGEGTIKTDSAEFDPATGTIVGEFGSGDPFVFTHPNGDELVVHYGRVDKGASEPGTFELTILGVTDEGTFIVEALFIAEFVPQPGSTGKFAGVTGGWRMYAHTEPFVLGSDDPVEYTWEGEGSLTLPKKPKKE